MSPVEVTESVSELSQFGIIQLLTSGSLSLWLLKELIKCLKNGRKEG